jgi:hypothetical protein
MKSNSRFTTRSLILVVSLSVLALLVACANQLDYGHRLAMDDRN